MFTLLLPFERLEVFRPVNWLPLPIKKLAEILPFASRNAIVLAVFAAAVVAPCNKLALRLDTRVVDDTTNGAVPVATLLINCGAVILAVASTCAVPKLFTFALPVAFNVPETLTPVLVIFAVLLPPA